ncbi:MAG: hypothetical protein ACFE9S_03760 [Candidatus Hermodarchaeota archaeon]
MPKPWKKDLDRRIKSSTRKLIIRNWGRDLGNQIVDCLEDCMDNYATKQEVETCFIQCVRAAGFGPDKITDTELKDIMNLLDELDNYETIGR